MSTQPPPHDSDDDYDYVPPVQADSSESSDDEPESKRPRTSPPREPGLDESGKKKSRDTLWSSFQASLLSTPSQQPAPAQEMVKIEKRFQFAGELVVEVVEVPANSSDAKKWPLWQRKDGNAEASSPTPTSTKVSSPLPDTPSNPAKPAAKKPGPRKSKISLAAIPTSSQKAKKLSTLDKSAMDWKAHIQASAESGLKEELEANRRGGGYLEKVEFLDRVESRREEVLEAGKGSKRRRN